MSTQRCPNVMDIVVSDQIRLKQAYVDKIHAWIEICEFEMGTKQFIYYMTNQVKKLLISDQVRLKQACTDTSQGSR